jgi:hypothetical protein
MLSSWNLFQSDGGLELVPEICLLIVEQVIDEDPKAVKSLVLISKVRRVRYTFPSFTALFTTRCIRPRLTFLQLFHSLLKRYERSITKRLSYNDKRFTHTNPDQATILASRLPPRDAPVKSLSYSWLSEMRRRSTTIEFLVDHEITQMEDHTSDWPTLDVPKPELEERLNTFKRKAFLLLYRLADCAVGLDGTKNIRAQQFVFLDNLSLLELATLGVMVEVIGQGYFTMTKKALASSGLQNSDVVLASISSSSYFYTPSSVPFNDLMSDNWVRECMCVFEDLIQRHGYVNLRDSCLFVQTISEQCGGILRDLDQVVLTTYISRPYFAWAYLAGPGDRTRRPDLWAR